MPKNRRKHRIYLNGFLVGLEYSLQEAEDRVKKEYGDRINPGGSNKVKITNDKKTVLKRYVIE